MPPVSRIRLRVEERRPATPCTYREPTDPPGQARSVPLLRLSALARIERTGRRPSPGLENALIDTGAWLSAIETNTWQTFNRAGLVEHLPFTGTTPGPAFIGGGSSAFTLGRVWISLHDLQSPVPGLGLVFDWLPAVPVIAQLLLDPQCKLPVPLVLGLHLGVLDGRKLTRAVVPVPAGPIPPNHASDCGPWFAQEWYLEDAPPPTGRQGYSAGP